MESGLTRSIPRRYTSPPLQLLQFLRLFGWNPELVRKRSAFLSREHVSLARRDAEQHVLHFDAPIQLVTMIDDESPASFESVE